MEYKAVYKCRLCGAVFRTITTDEELAEAHMVEINAGLYGTVPFTVRKTETHRCGGDYIGSLGLADFLGWGKNAPVENGMSETDKRLLAALALDIADTLENHRRHNARRGCV